MSGQQHCEVPEIFTKRVTRQLMPEELESRILRFLSSRQVCVLSTCRDNQPRSTPILFRSKGFTLYMAGEPGRKLGNIKINPKVSVGIFDPKAEFSDDIHDITGLQISGHAKLIGKDDPGFMEAFGLFDRPEAWARHWYGMMIEVVPDTIELLSMALKREEYAARQIWTSPSS
ncbi:MAG: pyridoxamine 5'-phosphate oxidase family protein [Chlorobium sp.]|uniref:pyridoxamine 5'-phosphate oxidase family protein n=1 Tax=Chlorobium sp. TaxID=1095 RepID=UPI0025B92471|nr:pyridoxamine 5'-phosphate oxidase family protein [Chlorobium sp.]MCF8216864.1 pyridoxamine 5'-phosphate oxidase family protein [Chlorobium sp.]MCF8270446.1 pyridoxamine 5'-phosphate oxidase family protein [Chlorobium sp.]MCF8288081.1 pyridoxamine 5'-phosphate oxidase family protein [Chlorobium sp.]MCF8290414.1 pyridoxamine 5'-phosphate oxidase family protein [Chlorobium sp.]MCF8384648.1 pyridoxamine 5'-phosphate oxidase family protein [Chlorobium sp.]